MASVLPLMEGWPVQEAIFAGSSANTVWSASSALSSRSLSARSLSRCSRHGGSGPPSDLHFAGSISGEFCRCSESLPEGEGVRNGVESPPESMGE